MHSGERCEYCHNPASRYAKNPETREKEFVCELHYHKWYPERSKIDDPEDIGECEVCGIKALDKEGNERLIGHHSNYGFLEGEEEEVVKVCDVCQRKIHNVDGFHDELKPRPYESYLYHARKNTDELVKKDVDEGLEKGWLPSDIVDFQLDSRKQGMAKAFLHREGFDVEEIEAGGSLDKRKGRILENLFYQTVAPVTPKEIRARFEEKTGVPISVPYVTYQARRDLGVEVVETKSRTLLVPTHSKTSFSSSNVVDKLKERGYKGVTPND
ncbi:hypothetical protein AKJ38_02555 [candidate division MSBL1 archaeon SCGC-AAA259I14]|uniref:Uncharacterized protein n=1 Tax=candidate division MSBL1 archaeon SCGC-AAA259I14 TaxID=1698268 RepID=A0A133URQ3_9EURY|nr:hypothetical protein AKJ38_02555 [candidate division MSBL1 archaeon SCGC-AAA259I14]